MTQEQTQGAASKLHGEIKAKWDKLSDKDINEAEKNMDSLSGRIQTAYGRTKEVVDREVSEFRKLSPSEITPPKIA